MLGYYGSAPQPSRQNGVVANRGTGLGALGTGAQVPIRSQNPCFGSIKYTPPKVIFSPFFTAYPILPFVRNPQSCHWVYLQGSVPGKEGTISKLRDLSTGKEISVPDLATFMNNMCVFQPPPALLCACSTRLSLQVLGSTAIF